MPDTIKKITPRNASIFALFSQGLNGQQVADRLGITRQAVCVHVNKVLAAIKEKDPDSPIVKQRNNLTDLLPRTHKVYRHALKHYQGGEKSLDAAIKVSDTINKGLQVLVPKSEEAKNIHTIEEKRLTAILDNKLTDQLGLDREIIDVDAIVEDTSTTPPGGGTTSDDE